MNSRRRFIAACLSGLLLGLLAGCAQPPPVPDRQTGSAHWRGRLALRVDAAEPISFFANFELNGRPQAGELLLTSPLGTTLAQMQWSPQAALLHSEGRIRTFDSLDRLATEATGAAIPIAALFLWLQGESAAADGWQVDLSRLSEGRLLARRNNPAPAAELRLILEQP